MDKTPPHSATSATAATDAAARAAAQPTQTPPRGRQTALAQHWHKTRRMTAWLLALWLVTGFCSAFYARELAGLSVFGWPLSFYLAAQGSSLVYLGILAVYAWRMRRLDQRAAAGMAADGGEPGPANPGRTQRQTERPA